MQEPHIYKCQFKKKLFIWMTLYGKKNVQIHTANFANSEMNSQVPPVSLKAELTVYIYRVFLKKVLHYKCDVAMSMSNSRQPSRIFK